SLPLGDFYRAARLVPDSTLRVVGELKEAFAPSVVPMDLEPQIAPYDKVFATLRPGAEAQVGDRFALLRPGRLVAPYGRIYAATGEAVVTAVDGAVVTVEVERMYDRVSVGDLLVPTEAPPSATDAASPAPLTGRLVALQNDSPLPSLQDIGFVDLGRSDGVQEGDGLEVLLPPERESWGVRPTEVIARLKVVRVADATSTVRVLQLTEPALREGLPVRRAASTP
ncbi:MAG TPA: hypothetical protein VFI96_02195, partial [Longimicrobiaceae bacterium]|nr:hypothetical protein [Longimicrobiaceae bacterium]